MIIIFSAIIVEKTNSLFYTITQNSKYLFYLISFSSLIFFFIIFALTIHFTEKKLLRNKHILIFRSIIISFLIAITINFIPSTLIFEVPLGYKSCGKEFNEIFISSAKSNDPSFCLNTNIKLNSFYREGNEKYCVTPNKDYIYLGDFSSGCIESFAKYTNNVSACNLITKAELHGYENCIMSFATNKLEINYCYLLPKPNVGEEFSDRDQCIKIISWRKKDKSLCDKIESGILKDSCIEKDSQNSSGIKLIQ